MAGDPTTIASRRVLAIVTLVVACGGGSCGRVRGSYTVSAQQPTIYSAGMLGGAEEEAGKKGELLEEPAAAAALAVVVGAPVALREPGAIIFSEGTADRTRSRSGVEEDHEVDGKEAVSEEQQQQQPRQDETTSRMLGYAARRRRYRKQPRQQTDGGEAGPGSNESVPGELLRRESSVDGGSSRTNHPERVAGAALEHARWSADRCWLDESGLQRCQANVFLFGVSKCGTSSLAAWMAHHPALRWVSNEHMIGVPGEEAHVIDEMGAARFNEMLAQGTAGKYGRVAPVASETDRVIDYTPHFSIKAEVPYRILDIYEDAARNGSTKYIVTLRDPVARAISSWQSKFDLKVLTEDYDAEEEAKHISETRFLAEAVRQGEEGVIAHERCLERELQLADGSWNPELKREVDLERCRLRDFLGATHLLYWAHVAKGIYTMQLERWFSLVGRENIKVLFLEETALDPVGALSEILEFIGLDLVDEEGGKGLPSRQHWEDVVSVIHNETDEARKRVLGWQVTADLVQSMRNFFAPYNAELQELLGRPLPENWSLPASSRWRRHDR